MARLFTVAISESNSERTEHQIWLLNNICSRINSLATVSHSVRDDTYSGHSQMIELLVQVLDASSINSYSGPRYREIEEALNALLLKYESQFPEEQVERARKSYRNKYDEFERELEELEEVINPDGDLSDEPVFRFFHKTGKRKMILERAELRKLREQMEHNKKEER